MNADAIREATHADLPRLRALQAHLAAPWPDLLDVAVDDTPAGGPLALVVETGRAGSADTGGPVGYVLVVPDDPETDDSTADSTRGVYVAELVVAPDHRREGHGSTLLDALASRFPGYDRLRLTARADDERALAFYRANGFRVLEDLPDHYEDADGLLLVRGLGGPAWDAIEDRD